MAGATVVAVVDRGTAVRRNSVNVGQIGKLCAWDASGKAA